MNYFFASKVAQLAINLTFSAEGRGTLGHWVATAGVAVFDAAPFLGYDYGLRSFDFEVLRSALA